MQVITDYDTTITKDMSIRQLRRLPDGDVSLDGFTGKPQNRFGWLPVYILLGPVWEGASIADYFESVGYMSMEFAVGVPESHMEHTGYYDACYMDWETGEFVDHTRDGWRIFSRPSPGLFEISPERRVPEHALPEGEIPEWH